ncbi:MAG: PAS domain-containing protein [Bacteroidales bacterium]
MSVVCAWCNVVIGEEGGGPITHGICGNCVADLQYVPCDLDRFLETLAGPVLAVDAEGQVLGANLTAGLMVHLDPRDMKGKLSGEVLSCIYAELPGGCGRTLHCTGCAIRAAFTHTWTTGESIKNQPAFSHRRGPDGPLQVACLVSTERLGPMILVQIEEAEATADRPSAPPA